MRKALTAAIKRIPVLGPVLTRTHRALVARTTRARPFVGSTTYWEARYSNGGNSGAGSYGVHAAFKADVLNRFVATHDVRTVIEFGCGDGSQLALARYPAYRGFDVSDAAIARCRQIFGQEPNRFFSRMDEYAGEAAELALSLDVIYHLVEDDVFDRYMRTLFGASTRYVIIYSSDIDDDRGYEGRHVRHRQFTRWVDENMGDWRLVQHLPNRHPYCRETGQGSFADFFIYRRYPAAAPTADSRQRQLGV